MTRVEHMCVGTFDRVENASQAINDLRSIGFGEEDLSILCSSKYQKELFKDVPETELPTSPMVALPEGAGIGLLVGGVALAVTSLVTGGVPILAAGTVLLAGGAIAGTFTAAMASMGYDRKLAEQCEHALQEGYLLVAVRVTEEGQGDHRDSKLADAERTLHEAGAVDIIVPATPVE